MYVYIFCVRRGTDALLLGLANAWLAANCQSDLLLSFFDIERGALMAAQVPTWAVIRTRDPEIQRLIYSHVPGRGEGPPPPSEDSGHEEEEEASVDHDDVQTRDRLPAGSGFAAPGAETAHDCGAGVLW